MATMWQIAKTTKHIQRHQIQPCGPFPFARLPPRTVAGIVLGVDLSRKACRPEEMRSDMLPPWWTFARSRRDDGGLMRRGPALRRHACAPARQAP